jgi:hypothetical protein
LRKKKFPKKKPTWVEERGKKGRPKLATLVSEGIGRDEKGAPINAHTSTLVGASSLNPKGGKTTEDLSTMKCLGAKCRPKVQIQET